MKVKAIETRYADCRFRSRTEARWAVFFDALGIAWEYEKEGFDLPSGKYLPDFWLPKERVWAEVKGGDFTWSEIRKCRELVEMTERPCLMLDGQPRGVFYWAFEKRDDDMPEAGTVQHLDYDLCSFPFYDRFFVDSGHGFPHREPSTYAGGCKGLKASLSARFEHGERG